MEILFSTSCYFLGAFASPLGIVIDTDEGLDALTLDTKPVDLPFSMENQTKPNRTEPAQQGDASGGMVLFFFFFFYCLCECC